MKILILSFFLVLCSLLYSQGNLQFNQVLVLTSGANYTVPSGKVLKIESILHDGTATIPFSACTGSCVYNGSVCSVDGIQIKLTSSTGTASCLTCPATNFTTDNFIAISNYVFPIWLSAGKIVTISSAAGIRISAIEFNIIP